MSIDRVQNYFWTDGCYWCQTFVLHQELGSQYIIQCITSAECGKLERLTTTQEESYLDFSAAS